MPAQHREIRPASIAPPAANYAHAVATDSATRWLHSSGVVPVAFDGTVPSTLAEQASLVWANIAALLAEAEMGPTDVISVTTYVVVPAALGSTETTSGPTSGPTSGAALGPMLTTVMAARDEFLGDHRAASTLVTVPALARPDWLMEIAIVAAR